MSEAVSGGDAPRRVLLVAHTGRKDIADLAMEFCRSLGRHGLLVRLPEADARELGIDPAA